MAVTIRTHSDAESNVFLVTTDAGSATAPFRRSTLLSGGSPFAATFAALFERLNDLAERAAPLPARLLPRAVAEEVAKIVGAVVHPAYRAARENVRAVKRTRAERDARIAETPAALPFAEADRSAFMALSTADQYRCVETADRSMVAALVAAGQTRMGINDARLWGQVVERNAVLGHIERSGLQADFQAEPTLNDPAATGPNIAGAEAAAREALHRYNQQVAQIEEAETTLKAVINAVAAATESNAQDAFDLLNGTER